MITREDEGDDNEFEILMANKIETKDKIEPQHTLYTQVQLV